MRIPNFRHSAAEKSEILRTMNKRLSEKYYRDVHSTLQKLLRTLERSFGQNAQTIIMSNIFRQMTNDQIMRIVHQFLIKPEYHKILKLLNQSLMKSDFKIRYNKEKKTSYLYDHIKPPEMCTNLKHSKFPLIQQLLILKMLNIFF
jgi:hypothetical protein